jgi:hypothetical protein
MESPFQYLYLAHARREEGFHPSALMPGAAGTVP